MTNFKIILRLIWTLDFEVSLNLVNYSKNSILKLSTRNQFKESNNKKKSNFCSLFKHFLSLLLFEKCLPIHPNDQRRLESFKLKDLQFHKLLVSDQSQKVI